MIELAVYLLCATVLAVCGQMLSGQDNGAFYAKGLWKQTGGMADHPNPKDLERMIVPAYKNLHSNESPTWYTRFGVYFFLLLAVLRQYHDFQNIVICLISAFLMTMGSSAFAGRKYQCFVNVGAGLPCIDPNENKKSEFYVGRFHFWWTRPFSGKNRVIAKWLGFLSIIGGFILGFII